ncbi:MAG: sigma 54-interacting transcriptional regulator [Phycisphaerales bacterium]
MALLSKRRVRLGRVIYLVQRRSKADVPSRVAGASVEPLELDVPDPTDHSVIHKLIRDNVLPLAATEGSLHINISPGTPAMHAVWLILHAGGAFPEGTRLWSTQFDRATARRSISPVQFEVTTLLGEIRRGRSRRPRLGQYDPEARSALRRAAIERLAAYSRVPGAPVLVLGERGTGKTRLVESVVSDVRGRGVVTVACGSLDTSLAESALFGHVKGAFTGADRDRPGLLATAKGQILFFDEIQDLPRPVQRKLVRVLQDRHRRFTQVGADREQSGEFDVVCASNRSMSELATCLDADLLDRVSHLVVEVPPLRACREDLERDWHEVWNELRSEDSIPEAAPLDPEIREALRHDPLPGNFRDLQRLALLCIAFGVASRGAGAITRVIDEWKRCRPEPAAPPIDRFFTGTRDQRVRAFRRELAQWARAEHRTWAGAAEALGCDERTLREDARQAQ